VSGRDVALPSGTDAIADALVRAEVSVRLDHIALAGARIRDLLPLYRDLLGGTFRGGGDNTRVGYRAVQFTYEEGMVELLEPLGGSDFLDRFIARGGGVHHVTFKVDDLEAAIVELRRSGVAPVGVFLDDSKWREAFIHPRDAGGLLVQLAQPAPGYPPPPGTLTLDDVLAGRGWQGDGRPSP
jgi:methylmalonyl-CoA/ethylmalonyl-CoA epimerase